MKGYIHYIAKFFEKREYAEQFMKGRLYLNSAKFFTELEVTGDGRADPHEGIHHNGLGIHTTLKINDILLNRDNGLIRSTFRRKQDLAHHLLCLYAADPKDRGWYHDNNAPLLTDPKKIESLRQALLPDPRVYEMGPWCVFILNPDAFFNRLLFASDLEGLSLKAKQVEYYDPETFEGSFPEGEELFYKEQKYAHQREYRVRFSGAACLNRPYILELGDLSSLTYLLPSRELPDSMQIRIERTT